MSLDFKTNPAKFHALKIDSAQRVTSPTIKYIKLNRIVQKTIK